VASVIKTPWGRTPGVLRECASEEAGMKIGERLAAWKEGLLFIISVCAAAKPFARHLEICSLSIDLQAYAETFKASERLEHWDCRGCERAR
jgi:hypothetical protein